MAGEDKKFQPPFLCLFYLNQYRLVPFEVFILQKTDRFQRYPEKTEVIAKVY